MRMQRKQFNSHQRLVNNEPLVVFGNHKNRDAAVIYHRRDGPLLETGPPVGTGPPEGTGPPRIPGNWLETIPPINEINGKTLALKCFKVGEERKNINLNKRKTKMKNFKLKRLLSLAFIGCLSALSASTVFAAAGDTISNTAVLTFDLGGVPTDIESSPTGNSSTVPGSGTSTDFTEDRMINFTVSEVGVTTTTLGVIAGATLRVQEFLVTNDGNDDQDFLLAALNHANGTVGPFGGTDNFDVTAQVFVETANAGFAAVDDDAVFIDQLAGNGGTATVYIVSTIPGGVVATDVAVTTLVAQVADGSAASGDTTDAATAGAAIVVDDNAHFSPAGLFSNGATDTTAAVAAAAGTLVAADNVGGAAQTVFNDPAGVTAIDVSTAGAAGGISGGVQDVVQNGQHSDSDSYTAGAAILTVTKTAVLIWDPANGGVANDPKAIPGAYMQYTITVANDALASASGFLTEINDTLAVMDIDPDLIDGTAAALAAPGAPESAAGDSFRIDTIGTGRNAALNVSTSSTNYCTAVADADSCGYLGGVGGTLTIDYALLESMDAEATGTGYAAGELKAGESVVIVFNAIIQ